MSPMISSTAALRRAVSAGSATITGVLRGILPDGYDVFRGLKMADIDPRKEQRTNCFTISDKARCIAGSVVTLVGAYEHGIK